MTFLVKWHLHREKRHQTLALFSEMSVEQEEASRGDVKVLGRWHDIVGGTGVMVASATSVEAIASYALNWNAFMDFEIVPVVDDEGARAVGRKMTQRQKTV